jgi:hypothetical protein
MQNKAIRRNVLPQVGATSGQTKTSQVEQNTWGRGIRFYVTLASITAGGGTDSLYLCALPPGSATPISLAGFSAVNLLSQTGTFVFDFYPGAWLPPAGIAAAGNLLGTAGVHLPLSWAVRVVFGVGNAATIAIDAEILP